MPEEENFNEEETYVSTKNAFSVYDNSLENFKPKYLEVEQIPEEENFNTQKETSGQNALSVYENFSSIKDVSSKENRSEENFEDVDFELRFLNYEGSEEDLEGFYKN